jgi:hypothetical protein
MMMIKNVCMLVAGFAVSLSSSALADENIPFPGTEISAATAKDVSGSWTMANNAIAARLESKEGRLSLVSLKNLLIGEELKWTDSNLFTIHLKGTSVPSSAMKLLKEPDVRSLKGEAKAAKLSERISGKALVAEFDDTDTGLHVIWRAILKDGSNYVRQEIAVTSAKPVMVSNIEMINAGIPGAKISGYTDGSTVVAGNWFLGLEHPMAKTSVAAAKGWTPAEMAARKIVRSVGKLSPGEVKVRFDYKSGSHRIDISKVELVANGKTVAEDVHDGYSGHAVSRNEYTLKVPDGVSSGEMVATLNGVEGQNDSFGAITVSSGEMPDDASKVVAALPREFTLEPGKTWTISTGIGVAPAGQMRKAFAYYLQRERAHPYRQYWHYNSWYDLNIGFNDNPDPLKRMTEEQCLKVIEAFDKNLYQKYRVGLNGYVWDDGWDDWNSLWQFHKGFPNSFAKLNEAAKKQGAGMGAWLSPWGGYGGSYNMRVKFGKENGYETNPGGFSLGGPKYYAAFRDTCVKMIRDYNQNYFKFDGIGGGMYATGAPAGIASDLDNLTKLLAELRVENPEVFINCTVGTWASPYWVMFADSVWRQGEDTSFSGKGNNRERWINYKDKLVYDRFVSKSPFFPVNSLMYHGLVVGPRDNPGSMPTPAKDLASFKHEMRMMAGYSSGLGELYVTPSMMTPESWKEMAESMKWSRDRKNIVVDSHWIGGNPGNNEAYGFAAYNPKEGGVITLRNPDDKQQTYPLDLASAFEIKSGRKFKLVSPYNDQRVQSLDAETGTSLPVTLEPFEVLVFDAK